eukprot:SAG11_NODE_90_length_17153_cov_63.471033_15_plen_150_part_00
MPLLLQTPLHSAVAGHHSRVTAQLIQNGAVTTGCLTDGDAERLRSGGLLEVGYRSSARTSSSKENIRLQLARSEYYHSRAVRCCAGAESNTRLLDRRIDACVQPFVQVPLLTKTWEWTLTSSCVAPLAPAKSGGPQAISIRCARFVLVI